MSDEKTNESNRSSVRGLLSRASALTKKNADDGSSPFQESVLETEYAQEEEPHYSAKPAEIFMRFHEFAREVQINRTGVFIQRPGAYALTLSHGLDRETIRHPETPEGFWTTMYFSRYDKNNWTSLSEDLLKPFLPLFSQAEQEKTAVLTLKTFLCGETKLIFCVLSEFAQDFTEEQQIKIDKDFAVVANLAANSNLTGASTFLPSYGRKAAEAGDIGYAETRILLDFTLPFEKLSKEITDEDKDVLFFSVYSALSVLAGAHNICKFENERMFSLFIFTAAPTHAEGCIDLIKESLTRFFDDEQIDALTIREEKPANPEENESNLLTRKI